MRKIKFRAWEEEYKRMLPDENITEMCTFDYLRTSNDMVLMQYTGLKDKKGKEIYEGDVVKYGSNDEQVEKTTGEVIFYEGCFRLDFRKIQDEYDISFDDLSCWCPNMIEIVGNVHQNPKLLK